MLAGLAGVDVTPYTDGKFTDVPSGAWYAPYVNWAAANNIVSGTSATTFDPNAMISRQDMAVMLYNYTQQYGVQLNQTAVTAFTDESSIAAYALPAVQALHRAGVINGMPDGSFSRTPPRHASRPASCCARCNASHKPEFCPFGAIRMGIFHILRTLPLDSPGGGA